MEPRTDPPDEMNDAVFCPSCSRRDPWVRTCLVCNGEGYITRAEAERLRESRRADTLEILED